MYQIEGCKTYHKHPKTDFGSSDHTYKGSLIRHIAIEKVFAYTSKPLSFLWRKTHNDVIYKLLKCPFEIIFGLNMNLPTKDVITFVVYYIKYVEIVPT